MEHVQLTGADLAELVQANKAKVTSNLRRAVSNAETRRQIVAEILDEKRYVRYNNIAHSQGELVLKLVIVIVYEAIDYPENAIHELKKYMYS
jgi:hypothetical protein